MSASEYTDYLRETVFDAGGYNYIQIVDDFGNPVPPGNVEITTSNTGWKFCPHCGERLEAAGAPFWNLEPLYNTNEARVREAEEEGHAD